MRPSSAHACPASSSTGCMTTPDQPWEFPTNSPSPDQSDSRYYSFQAKKIRVWFVRGRVAVQNSEPGPNPAPHPRALSPQPSLAGRAALTFWSGLSHVSPIPAPSHNTIETMGWFWSRETFFFFFETRLPSVGRFGAIV